MRDPGILEHQVAVGITPEHERTIGEDDVRAVVRARDAEVHTKAYARAVPASDARAGGLTGRRAGNPCAPLQLLRGATTAPCKPRELLENHSN